MTEQSDSSRPTGIEKYDYNPLYDDYVASRELLEAIQNQNREALDRSDLTLRFIDALKDVPYLAADAQVVMKQYYNQKPEGEVRVVLAALRQTGPNGTPEQYTREVGNEYSGMCFPTPPFTYEDIELAVKQLNDLQTMKTLGMLSIDNSLSYPEWRTMNTF